MQIVLSMHDLYDMLIFCCAKIQIFSQTNVKMLRLLLFLQQFNVFSRLSAILFINNRDN